MKYLKIFENFNFNEKDLISVDIQPEYEKFFDFKIYEYINFLNTNEFNSITILYNGKNTLDMISEDDLKNWLSKNGLEYEVLNNIEFYDKGYNFFRLCMDEGIDDDMTIALIKYMYNNNINDSRDIDEYCWDEIEKYYGEDISLKAIRNLLEHCQDLINIPDLMDFLKDYNNDIMLIGGGSDECLREVELALRALDKKYDTYSKFIY